MQGVLLKYMDHNSSLITRYVVLNNYAVFIYKDELAFQSFPGKPSVVIPVADIATVEVHNFNAQEILRNSSHKQFQGKENIYVLDIAFSKSYNKIVENIKNFHFAFSNENHRNSRGNKGQSMPMQSNGNRKNKGSSGDMNDPSLHFVDSEKQNIAKWCQKIKKCCANATKNIEV